MKVKDQIPQGRVEIGPVLSRYADSTFVNNSRLIVGVQEYGPAFINVPADAVDSAAPLELLVAVTLEEPLLLSAEVAET